MRRLTKEIANGNVGEQAGFDARMYAKSWRFCGHNSQPSRTVSCGCATSWRFAHYKQGCVSVVGPVGRLPA